MTWTPPGPCVRQAWLVLGGQTIQLENPAGGWFCSSLDLGSPEVRDVMSARPDQDGVDDRTQYLGSRVVTANITALRGAGAQIDAVASSFAPFMAPSARPVLHYILDRPAAPELTLVLRGAGYSWPIAGADQRDVQLQWVAADPGARDVRVQSAQAFAGASTAQGRGYPLGYNRVYPAGSQSATAGNIYSAGNLPVRPMLRIYGPVTGAHALVYQGGTGAHVWFYGGYVINAGHWVDVDCAARTVLADGDPAQNVAAQLDWFNTVWPYCLPGQNYSLYLQGSTTSNLSQVVATWQDRYLA